MSYDAARRANGRHDELRRSTTPSKWEARRATTRRNPVQRRRQATTRRNPSKWEARATTRRSPV